MITKEQKMRLWLGQSIDGTRVKNDFYETPPNATQLLLDNEKFDDTVWECSCGKGAISNVLIKNGYNVISDDLIDRGYGNGGLDFLKSTNKKAESLVTNPPYSLSVPFWEKCEELKIKKYAFLLRITWLEGIARSVLFKKYPLKKLYVFSKRIQQYKKGKMLNSPMLAFGWFVWEKEYKGKPYIDWI